MNPAAGVIAAIVAMLLVAGCVSVPSATGSRASALCQPLGECTENESERRWQAAVDAEHLATRARSDRLAAPHWLACSEDAYPGWHEEAPERVAPAAALATRCTEALLRI
uniref:hypothetical protein n=1 Tax=Novilysobacter viscosus TaxID=3098602 RepID=UPI002ED9A6DF